MDNVLTLVSTRELAPLDQDEVDSALQKFDALSLRLVGGRQRRTNVKGAAALYRRCDGLGLDREAWGWLSARREDTARAEAALAAELCIIFSLKTWYCNAESDVWRGQRPNEVLDAFVTEFYNLAPDTTLVYNGYSYPPRFGHPELQWEVKRRFHANSPMCYGTTREAVERRWDQSQHHATVQRWWPMVGVGRKDRHGKYWGFWMDKDGRPGIKTLIMRDKPDRVCWYLGNGGRKQLLGSENPGHPSLVASLDILRDAERYGLARGMA